MYNIAPRARFSSSVGNGLFNSASLDLHFAKTKNLVDATTGASLVTFTRASSGTFVGSDGVLRTAVTNLLLRSEEFQTSWTLSQLLAFGSGSVTDATTAPNGTLTADRITENTATAQRFVNQGVSGIPASSVITVSCYVKFDSANRNFSLQITDAPSGGSGYAELYLTQSGVVTSPTPSSFTNRTATVENVGSGWYRVRLTITTAAVTTITTRLFIVSSANAQSYTGDGTSGLFIWGAQLEQSTTVGEYIPTTSTINSAPRFDHNPTTGESLGLLVEEARTNSIRNNTMVGAVAGTPGTLPTNWTVNSTITGITAEIVGTGTSNGITYVDIKLAGTSSAVSAYHLSFDTNTAIAASTGQTWTSSSYLAVVAGSFVNITTASLRCTERAIAGSFVATNEASFTAITSSLSNNRITVSRSLGATAAFVQGAIIVNVASGAAIDITLRIGLPQLEQGAFATSPILTSTAAATRSADLASITGAAFSSWYRQDEGTVFADATVLSTSRTNQVISFNDGTSNNRVELRPVGAADTMRTDCVVSGVAKYSNQGFALTGQRRIGALAIKANDFRLQSGASGISPASDAVPTVDRLYLNYATFAGGEVNGTIRRFTYFPTRLANNTLQSITQ